MMSTQWISNSDKKKMEELSKNTPFQIPEPILEFLSSRDITTKEELDEIMNVGPHQERPVTDLTGLDEAAEFLRVVKKENKHLVILGDYDCDGVCATTFGLEALREIGMKVDYYINSRFIEGFGMKKESVDNLLSEFPTCTAIMTVDNGIVAFEGVDYANEKGIDVLITDHHLGDEENPNAFGVVNPNQHGSETPFSEICGAAVIYKVLLKYFYDEGYDMKILYRLSYLVGVATIGDVMPLRDENRFFVKRALAHINSKNIPAMNTLMKIKGKEALNEEDLGFMLVPMLNACGRLDGRPTIAMDFLLAETEDQLAQKCVELIEKNEERKALTEKQTEMAVEQVESQREVPDVIVVAHKDFHEGIVGIIAGRLKEKYYRPTIVLSEESFGFKGSARSIDPFHIKHALDNAQSYSDSMIGYGGHHLAAGLTVKKDQLDSFIESMQRVASETMSKEDLIPKFAVDAILPESYLTPDFVHQLSLLRPFGQGFQQPKFLIENIELKESKLMGKENNHARYVTQGGKALIDFFGSQKWEELLGFQDSIECISAIGYPSINVFRGEVKVQVMIEDHQIRLS